MHSVHEEVAITAEHEGTRVAVFSPDSQGDIAVGIDNFEKENYIHLMKNGEVKVHSPTK